MNAINVATALTKQVQIVGKTHFTGRVADIEQLGHNGIKPDLTGRQVVLETPHAA